MDTAFSISQTQNSIERVQESTSDRSPITTDSSQEETQEIIKSFDLSEFVDKEVKIISDTKPNLEFGENTQNESHVETSEGLQDQNYIYHSTEDGWYTIQNNLTKNYLTVSDITQSIENEIIFTTLTNSDNQKWRLVNEADGTFIIQAKTDEHYLTISEENTLTLKDSHQLPKQRWKITLFTRPTDTKNRSVATTPINVENGIYQFKNNKTGLFLSIGNLNKTIRTPLVVSQLTNTRESKFQVEKDNEGWYTITNSYSSLVLDVAGGIASPNTVIQQYNPNNTNAQKFRFVTGADGATLIESKLGLLIDVSSSSAVITTNLSETNSQGWTLTPTEAPKYIEFSSGDYQVTANGSNQVFSINNLTEDIRKYIQLKETTYGVIDLFTLTKN